MKIEIYDPAMCCPTGVCGPGVNPELVRMQETLRQIQKQAPGVQVSRYGLSADPRAFVDNAVVSELLKENGPKCLPIVFVNGTLICTGNYPPNEQFRLILKRGGYEITLAADKNQRGCCCGPGCC